MSQYLIPEQIVRDAPQPVYQQIYEQLKRELVLGSYRTGDRFFSYRKLKGIYRTELRTIAAAVELLIRDGLLEKRATSGIYVTRRKDISGVGNVWYAVLDEQCYHPFFFNILLGMVNEAEKYGLRAVVRFGRDRDGFLRWFSPRPGEGLIVTGNLDRRLLDAAAKKCNGNLVVVGNYDGLDGKFGNVATNCEGMIRESLERAFRCGCRRFGLITGTARTRIARDMRSILAGFCAGHGLPSKAVEELDENGFAGMARLERFRPDCVLLTEPAFSGAWEFLVENSLKCPEDVFLIRYGKEANDNSLAGRAAIDLQSASAAHGSTAIRMLLKNAKEVRKIDMELISHVEGI